MTNKLTDEELTEKLTKHCSRCPFCDSEDVESELMSADGPTAFTEVECLQCGAEWREHYKFVSTEIIGWPTQEERLYEVKYAIFAGSLDSVVSNGAVKVRARSRPQATELATKQAVNENPHWDERIEPVFKLLDIKELEEAHDETASD